MTCIGSIMVQGKLGPERTAEGRALLARGCEGGHVLACQDLAVASQRGSGGPVDDEMSARMFERSCELGGSNGFADLLNRVSWKLVCSWHDAHVLRRPQGIHKPCHLGIALLCYKCVKECVGCVSTQLSLIGQVIECEFSGFGTVHEDKM